MPLLPLYFFYPDESNPQGPPLPPGLSSTPVYGEIPVGLINGSNTIYTLSALPIFGSVRLYLNGLRQVLGSDYSVTGQTITFITTPPQIGDVLVADYNK